MSNHIVCTEPNYGIGGAELTRRRPELYYGARKTKNSLRGGPDSIPGVHVGFVVDKVALGQVFPPKYFGFSLSISFHRCSITWKNKEK
jgi:hypothetical protein